MAGITQTGTYVDLDLDFTSGFRFHPIEIIISMIIKC